MRIRGYPVRPGKGPEKVGTTRLNGVDPERWLREVLTRIADHPLSQIGDSPPCSAAVELS
jgi:hypothetical protein